MLKVMPKLLQILLVAIVFSVAQEASAQIKHGDATVYVDGTSSVSIASTYQRTLDQSTGVTYNWTCSSQLSISTYNRNSATIKGKTATTSGKVYFKCSYWIDGFYRTMNFYWDVVVKNSTVYVTNIVMSQSSATMTEGATLSLGASVYPTNATNRSVTWSSSSSTVASVSSGGLVTAKTAGTTTIKCRANDGSGIYATCVVTVEAIEPESVDITTEDTTIFVGETLGLSYTLMPSNSKTEVVWRTDNPSVATVDDNGLVAAVGEGEANIEISTANGLTDTYHLTVIEKVKPIFSIAYPEGGVVRQKVESGEILELQIVVSDGWLCNSVMFNDIDVTDQVDENGNYVTPEITEDSQLTLVFELNESGVQGVLSSNLIKLSIKGNEVTIMGADEFSDVKIYNTAGSTIYTGIDKSITLECDDVYILTVENRTFKFAM